VALAAGALAAEIGSAETRRIELGILFFQQADIDQQTDETLPRLRLQGKRFKQIRSVCGLLFKQVDDPGVDRLAHEPEHTVAAGKLAESSVAVI
jgi:hypothetical protein